MQPHDNETTPGIRPQWYSRNLGTRFGYRIFAVLIRAGGRRLAYFALYWTALYYVLCRPAVRRRSEPYLRHRFPDSGWLKRYLDCYRMFVQMGKTLLDRAIAGMLSPEKMKVDIDGGDKLLKLVDEGTGFILMLSHVGAWQVALSALHFLNVPVNLLLVREEGNFDQQYFEMADMSCPFRIIDPGGYLGSTFEMLDALKKGEVLCMMGDRVLGSDKSYVRIKFLGEEAPFPFSAFKIASAAGVPVVVFFTFKTGADSYALKVSRIIRPPDKLGRSGESYLPYVAEYVEELELFVKDYPYQFFNFYDVWQWNLLPES